MIEPSKIKFDNRKRKEKEKFFHFIFDKNCDDDLDKNIYTQSGKFPLIDKQFKKKNIKKI